MANKILLVGDGGHSKSVLDSLKASSFYCEIGIVSKIKSENNELKVVGCDNDLERLFNEGWNYAFITVGSVGDVNTRKRIYSTLKRIGFVVPNIIDKSAIVSETATLGEGIFVGKGAIINASSIVGNCSIINTNAVVEHDCKIGEFVHISPNSTLCGDVCVGNGSHIGAGSVVKQDLTIGSNTLIGIGSIVTKNIESNVIAYGNPCMVKN